MDAHGAARPAGFQAVSTTRDPMTLPAIYRARAQPIALRDREIADVYRGYTLIGDPLADRAVEDLASLPSGAAEALLDRAINAGLSAVPDAPTALTDLFRSLPDHQSPPFDPDDARAAYRAFHSQSDLFISAFLSATLRNASTLIAKSFYATGRVTSAQALIRIRHNTHHLYEIMLPGSLHRGADGWKLSIRIRFVHAQIRFLLTRSGHWDQATYGVPLSAAHLALASANFSATILREATRMGALLTPAARRGYMQVWRYASQIIGVPGPLLFDGDERRTLRFSAIAHLCEPPADEASAKIAHALINALPDMAGTTDPAERTATVARAFKVSRALLGHTAADALRFPPSSTRGVLAAMRAKRLALMALHTLRPQNRSAWQARQTDFLLRNAVLPRFDYRLPAFPRPHKAP